MRLFLAVFPPLAVREAVFAAAAPLRLTGAGVSWVKAENLHYTMRFLGEVGEDGAWRAAEAAAEAAAVEPAFPAELGAFGGFPNPARARVIWVGMTAGAARFTVERLSVVESTLSPKGSTYAVRAEAALRRAGRH